MAGSFGFEAPKYEFSMACAERVMLPAVRGCENAALVIADGYSCREQIVQCTGRGWNARYRLPRKGARHESEADQ